ncbi:hypothetical protein CDD81_6977 [Ophiocordyceps australis]|uniref:Cobalamin-independent methionine synthase MetE C-terminal/archaeal domain-containing protein n=1 Tax=Ophiocordyceps australis TaxID=1399860 RepID=A0A2C5YGT4_9HYPO|nr:hypothetical protein CDD81_6977 [Ophiocordyceps australis]
MAPHALPFHADQIGSLIRPAHLSHMLEGLVAGTVSAAELQRAQREAIAAIVAKQQAHGMRALTTGEFDRHVYFSGFFEALDGFRAVRPLPWELARSAAPPMAVLRRAGLEYPMGAICESKIRHNRSPYLPYWLMLRDAVPQEQWAECKLTLPPPCHFHLRLASGKCYSSEAYSSDKEFFADLTAAYRKELETLYDAGLRNFQIDDPTFAYFCNNDLLQGLRDEGIDPDELLHLYFEAHNDCIANRPPDLHAGLHVCRGNFVNSMYFSQGSYEKIAQGFFSKLNYDTFFLEYDTERAGGFEPLRFLPPDKNIVLGVVSTKTADMEDAQAIKDRVHQAAAIVAEAQGRTVGQVMQQMGISPQCGFASSGVAVKGMTEDKMFAKLQLVRNVARDLWPDRPESS